MKTARVGACLAIVLAWTLTSPLFAQSPPPGQFPGQSGDTDTNDFFGPRNAQFRSDIGDGVGYAKGFQTFGAFQSFVVAPEELIFFANPRGIITYLGDLSANVGAGVRWYDQDTDRILGGSFWYDHDNNGNTTYDQLGVSLEWLGKYFDVRANGYVPTNSSRDNLGSYLNGSTMFFQNFIGIGRSTIYNTPLAGGDFEIGGLLPGIGDIGIRPYVGGYYYQGDQVTPAYGVRARVEALITQDFWAQVAYTNDPLFGSNVMGAVTWYYGSGQSPRWFQRIPVQDRLYQQVERQYRIAVYEEVFNDTIAALRAGGTGGSGGPVGTPIFVVHVNNAAASGGDGTAERPLNYLPTTTAPNVDIVFVRRGNGTSTNYDQGITLNNYQRLLGDGVRHNFTSLAGTFPLPGYTPGALPTITNPGGDVVTLASYNEVSGFNIEAAGRHGIYGSGITDFNINNVNITGAGTAGPPPVGAGIELVNASGNGQIFDSSMTNNAAEGIHVDNFGTALALTVNNVTATGNLTGISLNGEAGAAFAVAMSNVDTSDNRHDGIAVNLESASTFAGTFSGITSNSNNNPQGDLGFGNGFAANVDASTAAFDIRNSTLNGNNLNGVSVVATNGSAVALSLVNNTSTISNNLLNGVFVDGTDSDLAVFLDNNVISNNGNIGVNLRATNGSLDLVAINNVLNANHGAGIAFNLRDAATGTLDIRNNTITGTLDDTLLSPVYNGQAIDIRLDASGVLLDSTAILTSGIVDRNTIGSATDATQGNAGGGIVAFVSQRATISNLTIGNEDGIAGNGNLIANNGGDGINFVRHNEAVVNNVVISDNLIRDNANDGIDISAFGSPNDENDYRIQDNLILDNGNRGVSYFLEADARIRANMFDNLIDGNTSHGIQLTELVNSAADQRYLTGLWERNRITNNGGSGVNLSGATNGLFIGTAGQGNTITDNDFDGIEINGAGSVTISGNDIGRNRSGGIDINPATTNSINISNNFIHDNRNINGDGDGIEILSQGPFSVNVVMTENIIRDNDGRGIDILNKVSAGGNSGLASITINDNWIVGNHLEGVYAINTSSRTQNQSNPSTDPLDADGLIGDSPRMTLTMLRNRVEFNGRDSGFEATGLVLRVGTSDGGYGAFTDGGFFSEGHGGVGAEIRDNDFSGNLGDDIWFDSFRSTVDPIASAGTWSDTEFEITAFEGDPLARLDLRFTGNTFNSTSVNNAGGPANSGAFYNNDEAAFKSRVISDDPSTGPFLSGTRERNAQRLAARFNLPPAVPGGLSDNFLYSGIGQSTFRLLDWDGTGGFITDDFYNSPFADANGVFTPGPFGPIEHMPYGWNFLGGGARPQ